MPDPRPVDVPLDVPVEVRRDVAAVVGSAVALVDRLPGGVNGGAVRVRLDDGPDAVLKAVPRAHAGHLDEIRRAQRVVVHMRARGYPTPAWLGAGATPAHVWHLTELVDAAPAAELTAPLVEQLMEIVEVQAGQASEPYDHWTHAWRVGTGAAPTGVGPAAVETPEQEHLRRAVARIAGHSPDVSALVERLRLRCAGAPPPEETPDMVHADLATPGNVLVRDGVVVAVVDIANAGSGTRAIDLTALAWGALGDLRLDAVRARLWARIVALVGGEGAAVLLASHVLHMIEVAVRDGRHDPGVVERGHRALDELGGLAR